MLKGANARHFASETRIMSRLGSCGAGIGNALSATIMRRRKRN
ncbi:hypothetical protein AOX55_00006750 (plasmid) [Sinorhizobium fredii CCBAU 25509]|nr:hypothetical protein AOX55_00006750 [Sinorhizobium fredii CCBAU 25509]